MILALTHSQLSTWWIAIGVGFVVVVVLAVLLALLASFLADVDRSVNQVSKVAKALEEELSAAPLLDQTAEATAALRDEAKLHADLVDRSGSDGNGAQLDTDIR